MADSDITVAATGTSLDVIQFIKSQQGARLSEIARDLDISKSTAHSHLNTLRNHGYVTKEGEIYHLSLKFFHLGQYARNRNERYQLAAETTRDLAKELNHSIDFDIEIDGRIMTLFHEASASTDVGLKEGDYLYVHTSSTGKAILAELPDERIMEILDQWGMPEETPHTTTTREELMQEVQRIQEQGYAIVDQEWLEGLRAVGVAVNLPDGTPFGALSAGGPTYHLTDDVIENGVRPVLLETARDLEQEIRRVVG